MPRSARAANLRGVRRGAARLSLDIPLPLASAPELQALSTGDAATGERLPARVGNPLIASSRACGLIAQEVEQMLPELVVTDDACQLSSDSEPNVIRILSRDRFRREPAACANRTEVYQLVPFELRECLAGPGGAAGGFPNAEDAAETSLALRIQAEHTGGQQAGGDGIVGALRL